VQKAKKNSFDATKQTTTNKNVPKPVVKKPVQPESDEESDDVPPPPKKGAVV
jgi:nucleolin